MELNNCSTSSSCSEEPVPSRMKKSYPKDSSCLSAESSECLTILELN